jgi:phosphoribosylformylglycinamidine synthase
MADVVRHSEKGGLVLGICNGAQISAESSLVPGVFTINEYPKFICREVYLRVENADSPFTSAYSEGEVIRLPIAHKEGRYVASPEDIADMKKEKRVAFRFCNKDGEVTPDSNPNGATENITGILGRGMNVLAMMPHPERASEDLLGSSDGKKIFDSMISYIESL